MGNNAKIVLKNEVKVDVKLVKMLLKMLPKAPKSLVAFEFNPISSSAMVPKSNAVPGSSAVEENSLNE